MSSLRRCISWQNAHRALAVDHELVVEDVDLADAIAVVALLHLVDDDVDASRVVARAARLAEEAAHRAALARDHHREVLPLGGEFGVELVGQQVAGRVRIVVEIGILAVRGHRDHSPLRL